MEENTKFCIRCGKKIPKEATFCQFCGSAQGITEQVNAAVQDQHMVPNNYSTSATTDNPYNENKIPGLSTSTKLYFKDMLKINKRMGRADYWWATLGVAIVSAIVFFVLSLIQNAFLDGSDGFLETDISGSVTLIGGISVVNLILMIVVYIILFIAGLTAEIRRLHDLGFNGAFWLINLIPVIGSIIMLIILCQPSKQRNNRYVL